MMTERMIIIIIIFFPYFIDNFFRFRPSNTTFLQVGRKNIMKTLLLQYLKKKQIYFIPGFNKKNHLGLKLHQKVSISN